MFKNVIKNNRIFILLILNIFKTHCISREKLHNLTPNSKIKYFSQLCALKHIINK